METLNVISLLENLKKHNKEEYNFQMNELKNYIDKINYESMIQLYKDLLREILDVYSEKIKLDMDKKYKLLEDINNIKNIVFFEGDGPYGNEREYKMTIIFNNQDILKIIEGVPHRVSNPYVEINNKLAKEYNKGSYSASAVMYSNKKSLNIDYDIFIIFLSCYIYKSLEFITIERGFEREKYDKYWKFFNK
jgi:hypothetical protein